MFGTGLTYLAWKRVGPGRGKVPVSADTKVAVNRTRVGLECTIVLDISQDRSCTLWGGYVLFAFLDTELVATGLLSRQQLIDAIAVGQFTPGPVFPRSPSSAIRSGIGAEPWSRRWVSSFLLLFSSQCSTRLSAGCATRSVSRLFSMR